MQRNGKFVVHPIYEQSVFIHKKYGKGSTDVHYTKKGYKKLGKLIAVFLEKEIYLKSASEC